MAFLLVDTNFGRLGVRAISRAISLLLMLRMSALPLLRSCLQLLPQTAAAAKSQAERRSSEVLRDAHGQKLHTVSYSRETQKLRACARLKVADSSDFCSPMHAFMF